MSKSLKKLIDINRLREFKNKLVGTDSAYVQTGAVDQTVAGTKTFSKPIVGSVTGSSGSCTGNAATATTATTAKSCTGNAATATTATTAKSCTGNAATATKLATARSLWGNDFDGSAAITGPIMGTPAIELMPAATTANNGGYLDFHYNQSPADYTSRIIESASGTLSINNVTITTGKVVTAATFNGELKGNVTGNCSGSSGSCTGNAASANVATKADSATKAANADHATSADSATKATQDAAGNTITTTYATKAENNIKANNSEVVHKSGDETIAGTKTFSNGVLLTNPDALMAQTGGYTLLLRNDGSNTYILMSDKGGVPGTWNDARPLVINNSTGVCSINGNADSATNAAYAYWLRTSSHPDYLFHTEWDGSYFWTYVNDPAGNYAAVRVARSDSSGNADHATSADSATRATSADRASAANCVQSQTSDYHEIRFDWGSQVPGCVGLRIDATDIGGIVTTNRLVSDIRAQWYAAYPDGPEAHNAMWGGRDITAAFNNGTVSANIANGTFKDIFPGDYITKQVTIGGTAYTVNWVIADCDYWINKGDTPTTVHHVVIVPQVPIFSANMNNDNVTTGGYFGSRMYRETIPACAMGIANAFGSNHILAFRDGITNSVDTSHVSSGITQLTGTPGWWGMWGVVCCNLMSEKMVYGAPICAAGAMDNTMATRQMSAFRLSERLINYNRRPWWLRDVVSSAHFAYVDGAGNANVANVSAVYDVRPFALLK